MTSRQDELGSKIGHEILVSSRNEMMVSLRFLDVALSTFRFVPVPSPRLASIATDGEVIYFNPQFLIEQYKTSRSQINSLTLHMLIHCLYKHLFKVSHMDPAIWNLAADIAVGFTLDSISIQQLNQKGAAERQAVYNQLQKHLKFMTAELIYDYLLQNPLPNKKHLAWSLLFFNDEHGIWYKPRDDDQGSAGHESRKKSKSSEPSSPGQSQQQAGDQPGSSEQSSSGQSQQQAGDQSKSSEPSSPGQGQQQANRQPASSLSRADLAQHWDDVSRKMQVDMETFSKEMGKSAGNLEQYIKIENRDRYDYGKFLRKFATLREEIKINDDEFDYIAYTYGLRLHKNLPFIEPLEYKDVKKIEEFVIAIDTSGSTSGTLVKNFLEKTYSILMSTENFFKRINVHIIQCDAEIQEDHKVNSMEDLMQYIEHYRIRGLGGTDFRPVFSYVADLIRKREFKDLKGLIYFTDGYGTYPRDPTPYDTAFVFIRDDYSDVDVPPWAIKLVLEADDLKE